MEQVFYRFHEKQSNFFLRYFSKPMRSMVEGITFLLSIVCLGAVILSHKTFVYRGTTPNSITMAGSSYIPGSCLLNVSGYETNVDVTHIVLNTENGFHQSYTILIDSSCTEQLDSTCRNIEGPIPSEEDIVLSYSQTKGFLFLPKQVQQLHNITSQYVIVSKTDEQCFGDPFLQKLVFYITGTSTVIKNWLLALHDGDGYIYNPKTHQIIDLHHYSTILNNLTNSSSKPPHQLCIYKLSILVTSLFLFFMTRTLTSFVLHETQNRMLKFTRVLQRHVRTRTPFAKLIFRHVVESLVFVPIMIGVLVFLMEFVFFGNTILGFGVLSFVWCGEVFSVICMRTSASTYLFPRVFFIYFTLFHVYFFSCPFGFSITALNTTFLMLLHSMILLLNWFEYPALQRGRISADVPRMVPRMGETTIQQPVHNIMERNSPIPRTNELYPTDQVLQRPLPPSGSSRSSFLQNRSTSNLASNPSLPSISTARGSPTIRSYGPGSIRSSSPSGMQSYPSASMFYLDGEGEDDDSYGIFMNGEIVRHTSRNNVDISDNHRSSGTVNGRDTNAHIQSLRQASNIQENNNGIIPIPNNASSRPLSNSSSSSLRGLSLQEENTGSLSRRDDDG